MSTTNIRARFRLSPTRHLGPRRVAARPSRRGGPIFALGGVMKEIVFMNVDSEPPVEYPEPHVVQYTQLGISHSHAPVDMSVFAYCALMCLA